VYSRAKRRLVPIVAIFAALLAASAASAAEFHKFHAHVDAHDVHRNSTRYCNAEWLDSGPFAHCTGTSHHGNAGSALGLHGYVTIAWCRADQSVCKSHVDHPHAVLPHGYSRWIRICTSADDGRVEHQGGPLFLYVGTTAPTTTATTSGTGTSSASAAGSTTKERLALLLGGAGLGGVRDLADDLDDVAVRVEHAALPV